MSFVCCICQDSLTERPQNLNDNDELSLCTLICGHLFHRACVQQWFSGNGASGSGQGTCPACKVVSQLSQALRIYPTGDEDSDVVERQSKTLTALITENQQLESDLKEAKDDIIMVKEENGTLQSDLERALEKVSDLKLKFEEEYQGLETEIGEAKSEISSLQSAFEDETQKLKTELKNIKDELSNLQSLYEDECAAHENLRMEQGELLSTLDLHQERIVENGELETAMENSVKTGLERVEKEKKMAMQLLARFEQKNKAFLEEMEGIIRRRKDEQELFLEAAAAHGLSTLDSTDANANSENVTSLIESLYFLQEDEDA